VLQYVQKRSLVLNMYSDQNQHRQATPRTVEVYGGSGLGLNISRKICQLHGGEVGLSSKAGDGSTFGFFFKTKHPEQTELDVACIQEQEIADISLEYQIKQLCALERIDASSFSGNLVNQPAEDTGDTVAHVSDQEIIQHHDIAQADSNTRGKEPHELDHELQDRGQHLDNRASLAQRRTAAHVLLVEDNIINQKILIRKLESRGYVVTAANNGKEAVELVERAPGLSTGDKRAFNICLMDMEMPVMDGNSATKIIRGFEKQGRIEHIPILGVTANVRLEQQAGM
jgi:CheY-like chemotaxis protein